MAMAKALDRAVTSLIKRFYRLPSPEYDLPPIKLVTVFGRYLRKNNLIGKAMKELRNHFQLLQH
ncbi:hypothetical protein BSPWISOXPB_4495 [uncultured Gammaproteobacteria bacterium]|nr:hypothetical protein BSPWISOXPB_4495 [uncultured Gammaproteobacteria bacterium]